MSAPPGRESQVRALKSKVGEESAFKIAWASYNKGDDGIPGVAGTEPRMTGHDGTEYTYGQKRGEEPSPLHRAMGDEADLLDDDDGARDHKKGDDSEKERVMDDDDDDGESVVKRAMDDGDGGKLAEHESEEERDEGEGNPSVDPSVIAAINFGHSLAPPSDSPVVSARTKGVSGPVTDVPVKGQEILHHSGK